MKVGQCAPQGLDVTAGMKCASLDGDADRIVYFFNDAGKKLEYPGLMFSFTISVLESQPSCM